VKERHRFLPATPSYELQNWNFPKVQPAAFLVEISSPALRQSNKTEPWPAKRLTDIALMQVVPDFSQVQDWKPDTTNSSKLGRWSLDGNLI